MAVGGTTGSGILLLSLLMAAGLQGANVIATDALISIIISFVKLLVFGIAGVMDAQAVAVALLIGVIALPGSFLAKLMVERMPVHVHSAHPGRRGDRRRRHHGGGGVRGVSGRRRNALSVAEFFRPGGARCCLSAAWQAAWRSPKTLEVAASSCSAGP